MTDLTLPVIDLRSPAWAEEIGQACRQLGFFYISHHGVDKALQARLEKLSQAFFAQDENAKMKIGMSRGNRAWRGYFPVGQELTSGKPDQKEGIYFGKELPAGQTLPLHGPNLFASEEMREVVLEYMDAMTQLGHRLVSGLALSLGLETSYFDKHYTKDPLILFRIFNYPPTEASGWGVGEHTDYGLLTILKQDANGGLEVRSQKKWISAPPLPDTFVCNIGDMLDRLTGGQYRSTPHRVKNLSGKTRLSYPFFFDPGFQTEVKPLPRTQTTTEDKDERWDKASVHEFKGTYGEYLLGKVSKVFPELSQAVLKK